MLRTTLAVLACACLVGYGTAGFAQSSEVEAIVQALSPKPVTRSMNRGIVVEGGTQKPEALPQINMRVHFEYDSSALTNDGKIILDTLGSALKDRRLAGMQFKIIGHTDAAGGEAYNLDLSRRRAEAVRAYLMQFHRIEGARLTAEGRGFRELADPAHPQDAANRRVQIVNVGETAATN
jgi:outer membrane protein OmpA-like peptidoglycan-associated protein